MAEVTVWSKPHCVQCRAVYRALDKAGVGYEVKNLPDFPETLDRFIAQGFTAAPVVEATGHDTFAGYNPGALEAVIASYDG